MDKKLGNFIEDKVGGLEKFYDRIIGAEVFLKTQNTSDKENKITEIKLNVPGDDFIVKKTEKTFEEGVSLATDSLRRSLVKLKDKQRSH
jgi:putative sigma-54 modulation protein